MVDKKILRKKMMEYRMTLSKEQRLLYNERILKRFLSLLAENHYKCIASYAHFRGEVETSSINQAILDQNIRLALPKVNSKEGKMDFFEVNDLSDLKRNAMGIDEPCERKSVKILSNEIDLFITPGVSFDYKGFRLGYGGGFYDKYFSTLKTNPKKVGLAFELQCLEEIPKDDYDHPVTDLITEMGHFKF